MHRTFLLDLDLKRLRSALGAAAGTRLAQRDVRAWLTARGIEPLGRLWAVRAEQIPFLDPTAVQAAWVLHGG
ncbi:MAG: hypothetical protein JWO31_3246 [Phycisphaerales bacterium]|nr:hypothetical protein [Phycisphaerales bacterium]